MLRIAVRWKSCGIRLGQPAAQSTLCHSSGKTSDATALVTNACRTVLQYLDAKPSRKVLDAPTSSPGVGFHAAPTVICTQGLDSGANSKVHTALGMSSCRKPAINPILETSRDCPVNGTVGKRVELLTVKALLRESALGQLNAVEHHFCSDPTCDVVYFDSEGTTYGRGDVRVPVWEKEPAGARVVCYCFGENEADMRREHEQRGSSDAVTRVRDDTTDPARWRE